VSGQKQVCTYFFDSLKTAAVFKANGFVDLIFFKIKKTTQKQMPSKVCF
jgi:hypothetical protein